MGYIPLKVWDEILVIYIILYYLDYKPLTIGGMHIQVVITWLAAPVICREAGELGLPAGNQTWLAGKSPIPDAPGMAYLPTYTWNLPSFVGKYSSTMEYLDIYNHMGLSENSVPLHPMVLLIIIPTKWL